MPAVAFLSPRFLKSRKRLGKAPWCLNVPPELSPTGKDQRLFFPTQKAAAIETGRLRARKDNFGVSLTALTPARIAEAAEAYNLLKDSGLSLLQAVHEALATHKGRRASIPFVDLFNLYLGSRAHRSADYLKELAWTRDRFPQLHKRLASEIAHQELETLLTPLTPAVRNYTMRYWRAVFNHGIKRGVVTENPVKRLDFIERPRREVETISADHVAKMLNHALANDPGLLPFLVLGFFCRIRPDGELQKILWDDVHLADRVVVIRPEVAKTNRRRFPELSANAVAWLTAYKRAGGEMIGKVVHYAESELRTRRTANWKAAGLSKWIHSGMRHTFCSNWLAFHKDVNKLVLLSGHDSVDTMWRHYFKGTTETAATEFWSISPADNVIPFNKQAA